MTGQINHRQHIVYPVLVTLEMIIYMHVNPSAYLSGISNGNLLTSLVNQSACSDSLSASLVVFSLPPTTLPVVK